MKQKLYDQKYLLLLILFFCSLNINGEVNKNFLTLEYVPLVLPLAMGGAGMGVGYNHLITPQIGVGGALSLGFIPVATEGALIMTGTNVQLEYFPLSLNGSGLVGSSTAGVFYLKAAGEKSYGGLESHFIFFYIEEAVGWRFILDLRKIRFFLEPELNFLFVLPGITGSGYRDNLTWQGTGLALSAFYPNLLMGINY